MKCLQKTGGISKLCIAGTALLFLLACFPAAASAAEEGYTMSLRPSAEVVNPGDTIQLAVQVHNDGWPDSGEAEVAAFQATLEYDRSLLEYQSVEIPEGTMGDFRPDSGIVLGYGEGHAFQESYDCAVLTMKVSEGAAGEIPVTIHDVILAKQDATELTVSAAAPLTLYAGSAAVQTDGSGQSSDSGSVSTAGSGAGTGETGNSGTAGSGAFGTEQASAGTRAGQSAQAGAEGAGAEAAASGNPSDLQAGASGESSADGSVSEETDSGESGNGEGTAATVGAKDQTTENAEATGTDAGEPANASGSAVRSGIVLVFLLAAVAAAGAVVCFYRKRKRT